MGLFGTISVAADANANANANANQYHRYSLIGLAFVARMAMMGASCTTWVSTSEMLTTDIRATGHGAANAMCRLGGFFAPYFITEGNPLSLVGLVMLLVAFATAECAQRLPETGGKAMGDIERTIGLEHPIVTGNNDGDGNNDDDDDDDTDSEAKSFAIGVMEHAASYRELS